MRFRINYHEGHMGLLRNCLSSGEVRSTHTITLLLNFSRIRQEKVLPAHSRLVVANEVGSDDEVEVAD
jgi:hypothetical protein